MPLAPELRQAFTAGHRAITVQIVDENLKLGATLPKGSSEAADFDKLKGLVSADAPCYLLFHLSSPSGWLIITYIPETVKVSDKMVYAATKSRLKTELGNHTFVDEMHANEPSDLVWSSYAGAKASPVPYSRREKAVHALDKAEADARVEFNTHSGNKSSGYHTVTLPFTESATAALEELKQGTVNFVELKITEAKNSIEAVGTKTVEVSELSSVLPEDEPRFCFFHWANAPAISAASAAASATTRSTVTPITGSSVSSLSARFENTGSSSGQSYNQTGGYRAAGGFVAPGGLRNSGSTATATASSSSSSASASAVNTSKIFFIYYCPDKSPPQLRMVYSTAKPAVASSAEPIVGQIRRKVEVCDRTELTEEYMRSTAAAPASPYSSPYNSPLQARLNASRGTAGGSQLGSSSNKTLQGHPVYTMGAPTVNVGGKSKRIVIPPSVAYHG